MAAFNGNNPYLTINGHDVGGIWRNFELSESTDTEDTTAGAGVTHVNRAPKLQSNTAKATVVYDASTAVADLTALYHDGDTVAVVWGIEGNTNGKPKHDQDWVVTGIKVSQAHDKAAVVLELDFESDGAPRSNMYAGDVWAA
jgi:hypothetical protein